MHQQWPAPAGATFGHTDLIRQDRGMWPLEWSTTWVVYPIDNLHCRIPGGFRCRGMRTPADYTIIQVTLLHEKKTGWRVENY